MRFPRTSLPAIGWSHDPALAATSQHSSIGLNPYAAPFHPSVPFAHPASPSNEGWSASGRPTTPSHQIRHGRDDLTDMIMARIQLDRRRQAQREQERQAREREEEDEGGSCRRGKVRRPRSRNSPPPEAVYDAGIQPDGQEVANDWEMVHISPVQVDRRSDLAAIQEEEEVEMNAVSAMLDSPTMSAARSASPRSRSNRVATDSTDAPQLGPAHPPTYEDEGVYDQIFLFDSDNRCEDVSSDEEDVESNFEVVLTVPETPLVVVTPPSSTPVGPAPVASGCSPATGALGENVVDRFALGTRNSNAVPIVSPSPQDASPSIVATASQAEAAEERDSPEGNQADDNRASSDDCAIRHDLSFLATSSLAPMRGSSPSSLLSTPALDLSSIPEFTPRSSRSSTPATGPSDTQSDVVMGDVVLVNLPRPETVRSAGAWRKDRLHGSSERRSPRFRPRNLSRMFTETGSEGRYPSLPPAIPHHSTTEQLYGEQIGAESMSTGSSSSAAIHRSYLHPGRTLRKATLDGYASPPLFSPFNFPAENDRIRAYIDHCFAGYDALHSNARALHNRAFVHSVPCDEDPDDIDYHLTRPIVTTSIDRLADGMLQYTLRLWRWDGQVSHIDGKIRIQQYIISEKLCEESPTGYGVVPLLEPTARLASLSYVLQNLSYVSLRWPEFQSDRMAVVLMNESGGHFGETLMTRTRDTVMDPLVWTSVCHRILTGQSILAALPFNTSITGKEMAALIMDNRNAVANPPYSSLFCPTPETHSYHHQQQYNLDDNLPPFVQLRPATTVINGLEPAVCLRQTVKA